MNHRLWIALAAAALLAAAGCSKKEEAPAPQTQAQTQTKAEAAPTAAPKPAEAAGSATAAKPGKAVYEQSCAACHDQGVAGAPKIGDQAAWQERIAKGMETLVKHSIDGFQAMPPKGGNPALSDEEVKAAVQYLVEKSR